MKIKGYGFVTKIGNISYWRSMSDPKDEIQLGKDNKVMKLKLNIKNHIKKIKEVK